MLYVLLGTWIKLRYKNSYPYIHCIFNYYVFKNTKAFIYFSVYSRLLNCIILLASSNLPVSPQQICVCNFCTSS